MQATCDRVIIINDGTIAADGTLEQLQNDFRGSEKISLELKASVANAMTDMYPKLQSLAQVESVRYDGQEGDVHKFSLHTVKGSNIREAIFHQAVAERWVLLELTRTATSLEEVFHKLTTNDATSNQPEIK